MDQDPHSSFASGALVAERYRITGTVGRGAMGAVYAAQHVDSGQKVALKFMSAPEAEGTDAALRFMQEARVMAELHSPHTIRLYDFGRTSDGAMFMAMELLVGKPLNAHLKDLAEARRTMGQVEAADIAIQVLRSLGEAHARGLVHRDLKPGNIFLTDDGTGDVLAKVLDFGIARVADSGLTQAGHVLGTPLYMSPEQWRSDPVDGRADLYALGCVLFHCVAGHAPFGSSGNVMALMLQHCDAALPDPRPDAKEPLADEFVAVMHRAMEKKTADRFADAREMRLALEAAVGGAWAGTPSPRPGWRPISSGKVLAPAAASEAPAGASEAPSGDSQVPAGKLGAPAALADVVGNPIVEPARPVSSAPTVDQLSRPPPARRFRPAVAPTTAKAPVSDAAAPGDLLPAPTRAARALSEALTPVPAALPLQQGRVPTGVWVGLALVATIALGGGIWSVLRAETPPSDAAPRAPGVVAPALADAPAPKPFAAAAAPESTAATPTAVAPPPPAPDSPAPVATPRGAAQQPELPAAGLPSGPNDGDTASKPKPAPKARNPASRTNRDGPRLKMVD
ncbi:MAG: serine/threonine protein kinase [Myxococcales bacterium]|nr:serine/threonine protein kinase [Myxococcales bacterium]